MVTHKRIFSASTLMLCALLCQPTRADEPTVVADGATDFRKAGDAAGLNSLGITLKITADEVARARSVMATVTSAVDERGQSLMDIDSSLMIWRDLGRSADKGTVSGYLDLKSPARADKKVREITGRVEFYDPARDPRSIVTIADIGAHIGQTLTDPTLKAAGLEFIYLDKAHLGLTKKRATKPATAGPSKVDKDIEQFLVAALNEDKTTLALISKNSTGRLVDIEIETAQGQLLKNRLASITPELLTYQYREEIPKGARLKIYVATPQSVTKIPFKLSDVPLP